VTGVLCAVLVGACVLGALAHALGARGSQQRAADLGALAAAKAMRDLYPRLFVPAVIDGRPNPRHVERAAYLAAGRRAAESVARANGADAVAVSFPHADPIAPVVVRVDVGRPVTVRVVARRRSIEVKASADGQTAFAVDLLYAALVGMRNVPEDAVQLFLLAEAPRILFPFARQIVAQTVQDGGFPPLMLDPIDFHALYEQRSQQAVGQDGEEAGAIGQA